MGNCCERSITHKKHTHIKHDKMNAWEDPGPAAEDREHNKEPANANGHYDHHKLRHDKCLRDERGKHVIC